MFLLAPSPRRRRLNFSQLAMLLMASLFITSIVQAQGLVLRNSSHNISQLEIGDDLFVRLPLMLPTAPLELHVLDEAGQSVAALAPLVIPTNPVEPVPLWLRTGVVGCDVPGAQDVLDYHFRDFQEASAHLVGRTFTVELRYATGAPVFSVPLPIKARPTSGSGSLYFSDSSGCPRTIFDDRETVYLSGFRSYFPHGAMVYMVDPEQSTDSNGNIIEVRPSHLFTPQVISSTIANGDWTQMLWPASLVVAGDYGAIVGSAQGRSGYALYPADGGVGALGATEYDETNVHGITILELECVDCDPINWKWGLDSP